ncbi:16S rRNA (adenine(1518)-N(6)/adenine(1519)-N(6))-dimethyltransferase RsmA [Nitrococcus mobilis]|uniref:Ribosomal RNA small subunit methyltransferase A n=1 Tax=Nitrococcus mobilis Nb-231 TaxID=314278 RepID=A4BLW2_9GAMM|nr:16S rRNA (adenine(1518)-N(6)/adenine(1519)-N(6))-dimethyltransferase RsmA [Nitrococcus mobilis]EAR23300.1 dimethyladenosine transferase [Nitrococcus mobilis Nb-231]
MSQHRARRRFGQNFLHDPSILHRMVDSIDPRPGQCCIEIGSGLGALTRPLLERARALVAIELDRDLIEPLRRCCDGAGELEIIQADALGLDFACFRQGPEKLRVIGNLPYNIATPLLFHVTGFAEHLEDAHFLLQKEVVERMAAGAGQASYGRLSVMIQYRCRVEPLFDVLPNAFRPVPKVTSSWVRLTPLSRPPRGTWDDEPRLAEVVARAFGQRRKTLRNALRGMISEQQIKAAGIEPSARAETIDLDHYLRLAEVMAKRSPGNTPLRA